jgi:hypothetical protein
MSEPTPSTRKIGIWAIYAVVLLAIVAVVYVAAGAFGITIPPFVITIAWICVAAALIALAIRFLMSLGS